jgi:hypothetical protein
VGSVATGMNPSASLDVLIAQIQIQFEQLGSLVVTSPVAAVTTDLVAKRIVDGFQARGISIVLCVRAASDRSGRNDGSRTDSPAGGKEPRLATRSFTSAEAGTPQLARSLLGSEGLVTVASAPGLLEDPVALFLAAAADAVLLVGETGKTSRADLKRARLELDTAGAHLVGGVLSE